MDSPHRPAASPSHPLPPRLVREVLMRHGLLVLTALCAALRLQAQGRITGTVTDSATARPIAGPTVVVLGTNRTAATNTSGAYVITDVPAGTRQVRARFVGYASVTQSVAVDAASGTTLDFRLVAAPIQLEGLVVVGYGTQERRDLTGSIGSVTPQQIAEVPTSNPMQAIQARVAGVDVVAGGSYRPGIPMNVTVRGIRSIAAGNGPLYVVGGAPPPKRPAGRRATRACSHPTSCRRCCAPRMRPIRPRIRDARPGRIGSAACCGPALSSAISSASRPSRGPPGSPSPAATSIRTASPSARGIGSTPAR